jgi:DNA-binding response OmpR family regulator
MAPKGIRNSLSVARETVNRETPQLYEFGPFHLDPNERKLLRGSEIVELTPKAFDTLLLLVRNSGHLLEKARDVRRRGQPIQQHLSPAKGLG